MTKRHSCGTGPNSETATPRFRSQDRSACLIARLSGHIQERHYPTLYDKPLWASRRSGMEGCDHGLALVAERSMAVPTINPLPGDKRLGSWRPAPSAWKASCFTPLRPLSCLTIAPLLVYT